MAVDHNAASGPAPRATAILVVHGVGQQRKYQTISDFAAGMALALEERGTTVSTERLLQVLPGGPESVLRLHLRPSAAGATAEPAATAYVDIVEYYYQPALQRQVDVRDVIDWLLETSAHVRDLYEHYKGLRATYADDPAAPDRPRLKAGYMLYHSAWLLWAVVGAAKLLRGGLSWSGHGVVIRTTLSLLYRVIEARVHPLIVDYAGDVTAYTAIDPRSKFNTLRRQILHGCADTIRALADSSGDHAYDQVLVAGHSLGSVVAYDALSALSRQIDVGLWSPLHGKDVLKTLITFGSPLDKIAFFFWPLPEEGKDNGDSEEKASWRRRQATLLSGMLPHFYGVRGISNALGGKVTATAQPKSALADIEWVNFWHPCDLIAGHLDAYSSVVNIALPDKDATGPGFPEAHSYYWYHPGMYRWLIDRHLMAPQSAVPGKRSAA